MQPPRCQQRLAEVALLGQGDVAGAYGCRRWLQHSSYRMTLLLLLLLQARRASLDQRTHITAL